LKHRHWLGAGLLALGLAACAEPPNSAANLSPAAPAAVRLIIRFTNPDSVWTATDLARLQKPLLADISPVAAVSSNTWAYRAVPHPGQDVNKLLGALRARPEVTYVDIDGKTRNP
jgi:hypothetical protein